MRLFFRCTVMLLILMSCGCSFLVKEPRVTVTRTRITGLDMAGVNIECSLAISNPNSYDLTLMGYSYDLHIMSLPLASGDRQEPLEITAGKQTEMKIPIRIKYDDLVTILKRKPDLDHVPYRLKARLQLATSLGGMLIPIDISDTIRVPEKYRPEHHLKQLLGAFSSPT